MNDQPNLGLATTRQLLDELRTRIEIDGKLDYRTVGDLAPGSEELPFPDGESEAKPARVLPEGKRAIRTKTGGDRVYLLDDVKKTRQWVTNPEVLKKLGFELEDVTEIDEAELMKYQMSAAIYKVDE